MSTRQVQSEQLEGILSLWGRGLPLGPVLPIGTPIISALQLYSHLVNQYVQEFDFIDHQPPLQLHINCLTSRGSTYNELELQMLWKEITIEHTGQYYCCVVTMSVTDEMNIAKVTWAEQGRLCEHKENAFTLLATLYEQ